MKTTEWAAVICCRAKAVSNGNPTTTPTATIRSDGRSRRIGRSCLNTASSPMPSAAASTARAEVRKSGSNPPTATRVAGSEPLKMRTPSIPLPQPGATDNI